MKKITFALVVLLAAFFTSCDELLNQTIDINTSFTTTYDFSIDQAGTIERQATIDVSTNSDLEKYLDKIQGYALKSIIVKVKEYQGAQDILFNGELKFSKSGSTDKTTIGSITDLNLYDMFSNNSEYKITVDQTVQDAISQELLDNKMLTLYLEGSVSDAPVTATLEITINTTVKANPLK